MNSQRCPEKYICARINDYYILLISNQPKIKMRKSTITKRKLFDISVTSFGKAN